MRFGPSLLPAAAFTLVELLAVVAVIATLAALALPGVQKARRSAFDSIAVQRLSRLMVAETAFAGDNGNTFTLPVHNSPSGLAWQNQLAPYVLGRGFTNNAESYANRQDPKSPFNVPDSKPKAQRTTAAASIALNYKIVNGTSWLGRTMAIPHPSRIILLAECVEANSDTVVASDKGTPGPGFRRIGNRAAVAFCDSHVEFLDFGGLKEKPDNENSRWFWW